MKLLGYWRSSATYRVRIVLALKGLAYDYEPVNLLDGAQRSADYIAGNPQALVPTLITFGGERLTQSLAIIDYLEETYPKPSVLPRDPVLRAKARAIALAVACEAQPFGNLRLLTYLKDDLGFDDAARKAFLDRWVGRSLKAVAALVRDTAGKFAVGDEPGLADAFIVPQLYAARRFNVDLSGCEALLAIDENCAGLEAFVAAHPDNQPDAPKG